MTNERDSFDAALAYVRDAGLPHPDGHFLDSFLQCAVDRDRAAAYFFRRCPPSAENGNDGLAIRELLSDWKFIVSLCQSSCLSHLSLSTPISIPPAPFVSARLIVAS